MAWWNLPPDRKNVIPTFVIAVATVAYVIYAGLLWRVTQDALEAQSRPILLITDVALGSRHPIYEHLPPTGQAGPPHEVPQQEIAFAVQNVGRGPAFRAFMEAYWQTYNDEVKSLDLFGAGEHWIAPPFSKQIIEITKKEPGSLYVPRRLWEEALTEGSGLFQIFGWTGHCDFLGTRRNDPFCFEIYKSIDPVIPAIVPCVKARPN
jgi:hypothetical protein